MEQGETLARSVLEPGLEHTAAALNSPMAHLSKLIRPTSRAFALFLFAVAAAVVVRAGASVTWRMLSAEWRRAGPALALVFVAPAVGNALHMLGWRLLFSCEMRPHPWRAYRAFLAAQAGNELGLGLMGEPLKVAALPRKHRDAAVAALLLDNLTSAAAIVAFFLSLGCFALAWFPLSFIPRRAAISAGVVATVLAGLGFVGWRALGARPLPFFRRTIAERFAGRLRRAATACRALVSDRPSALAGALGFHYLGKLWMLVEMLLVMHLLGCGSVRGSVLFSLASAAGSLAGAPVPGQAGVIEAALVSASDAAGISVTAAVAIALLRRIRGGLWVVLGALLSSGLLNEPRPEGVLRA
jgi:hypothetical protein